MTSAWHMRPYRPGDEYAILKLRRAVFGAVDPVRLAPTTWTWQFRDNPAGPACCCLAEDRGAIVGQYAVIPTRFSVNGQPRTLYLSCDTMTHPRYRRQGMFTALALATYDMLAAREKNAVVWGFPNTSSLPGFVRDLGWQAVADYPLRVAPLRPLALLGTCLSFGRPQSNRRRSSLPQQDCGRWLPRLPGLRIKGVDRFGAEADTLWQQHRNLASVLQVRDARYLNWRYRDVAAFDYRCFAVTRNRQLCGYVVLRLLDLMGHCFGVVVDMFPFPMVDAQVTREVLRFARRYCRARGASFVSALFSHAGTGFMFRNGFVSVPRKLNPRRWMLGCRFSEGQKHMFASTGKWCISYGDTDIV